MICKGLIRFYSLYFQQLSRGSSLLWHVVNHGGWGRRVAQPTTQPQRWLVISSTCWHPWWWRIMSWIYPVKTNVFLASQCGNSINWVAAKNVFNWICQSLNPLYCRRWLPDLLTSSVTTTGDPTVCVVWEYNALGSKVSASLWGFNTKAKWS